MGNSKVKENKLKIHSSTSAVTACDVSHTATDRIEVVNSHNEWDPLEEIVVGRIEDSVFPPRHPYVLGGAPQNLYDSLIIFGGLKRWPKKYFVDSAQKELDQFISILKSEGIKVQRPDIVDHSKRFSTPDWSSKGYTSSCPRDCFLIVGNEIIEAPMSWRCRYFEPHAYYSLFKEYFEKGAKWTSAPKPPLRNALYKKDYTIPDSDQPIEYVINESEIVFDAADFIRCGTDIFVTKSNVTNMAGINWLRRHLGDKYNIHIIETLSKQPMHIDTTFVPLGPGKAMINPKYVNRKNLPKILKTWDIFDAPAPNIISGGFLNEHSAMCSMWLNMNILLLDEERVIVEKSQQGMIKALKNWGLKPILCNFLHFNPYGGAFHCATLDIRRAGILQSYT